MKFFSRKGKALPVSDDDADYRPGDFVTWMLSAAISRTSESSPPEKRPAPACRSVIHNIGSGAQCEDVLRAFKITGHYRW